MTAARKTADADRPDKPGLDLSEHNHRPVPPRRAYDRRRHDRRYFEAPVRFMTAQGGEFMGLLQDISPSGLRISADHPPPLGDAVILYVDKIGRFEGRVVRSQEDHFALQIAMSALKLARLEKAIMDFFETDAKDAEISDRRRGARDRRTHERRAVEIDDLIGVSAAGEKFKCRIANLSLGGAEIITDADLELGEIVTIGANKGVVTRMTPLGYAVKRL